MSTTEASTTTRGPIEEQHGPRSMSATTAAPYLGVSPKNLYALAKQGIVPSTRVGRMIRFSARQLDQFIASGGRGFARGWRKDKTEPRGAKRRAAR